MEERPYLYELDDFYLVPASLALHKKGAFTDFDSMIRMRNPKYDEENLKRLHGKRIIYGHTVTQYNEIVRSIEKSYGSCT